MGFRVLHKGLVLVAVPLVLELIVIGILAGLLFEADHEQAQEAERCRLSIIGSRLLFLNCSAGATLIDAFSYQDVGLLSGFYEKIDLIDRLNKEMSVVPADDPIDARDLQLKILKSQSAVTARMRQIADTVADGVDMSLLGKIRVLHRKLVKELDVCLSLVRVRYKDLDDGLAMRWRRIEMLQAEELAVLFSAAAATTMMALFLIWFYRKQFLQRINLIEKNVESLELGKSSLPDIPALAGKDEIAALDAAFRDMSSQLAAVAERERALFENSSDMICVLDETLKVVRSNRASLELCGFSSSEIVGNPVSNIVADENYPVLKERLLEARKSGQAAQIETTLNGPDNKRLAALWSVFWSPDKLLCHCVVHDVTDERELDKVREAFLRLIAADFRQPLTELASLVDRLSSGECGELPESATTRISGATKTLARMVTMVDELIQLETLKSSSLNLDRQVHPVKNILLESVKDTESLAERQRVKVSINCPEDLSFEVDFDRLVRVVTNFLSNAIKFSPENSMVELRAEKVTDSEGVPRIEVSVIDRGRGIPKDVLGSLFQAFKQVASSDGKRGKGTGLGLVVCKRVIEEHGGKVGVESEEGQGSRFWFRVPEQKEDATVDGAAGVVGAACSPESGAAAIVGAACSSEPGAASAPVVLASASPTASSSAGADAPLSASPTASASTSLNAPASGCVPAPASAITTAPAPASTTAPDSKQLPQKAGRGNFWERLSFKQKGMLLVGLPIVFQFVLVAAMAFFISESRASYTTQMHNRVVVRDAIRSCTPFFLVLVELRSHDYKASHLQKTCDEAMAEVSQRIAEFKAAAEGDELATGYYKEVSRHLKKTLLPYMKRLKSELSYCGDQLEPEKNDLYGNSLIQLINGITSNVEKMVNACEARDKDSPQRLKQIRQYELAALLTALGFNIAAAAWLAVYFSTDVVRRLLVLSDNSQRLAAEVPLNPPLTGSDEIAHLDKSFHDTARRLKEARAAESTFLDNANNIICSFDAKGSFVSLNRNAAAKLAIPFENYQEYGLPSLISSEQKQSFDHFLANARESGKPSVIELKVQAGENFVDLLWSFLWSAQEELYFAVAYDITAQRDLDRMKKEFLALVTHDLRTPLTTIQGMAIILETGKLGALPEPALASLKEIRKGTKQILDLVNDLLDLSKLEAGEMKCDLNLYPLAKILDRIEDQLEEAELEIYPGQDFPAELEIEADSERLAYALAGILMELFKKGSAPLKLEAESRGKELQLRFLAGCANAIESGIDSINSQNPAQYSESSERRLRLPLSRKLLAMQGGGASLKIDGEQLVLVIDLAVKSRSPEGSKS